MAFGDRHLAFALRGPHSVAVTMGTGASLQSARGILDTGERVVTEDGLDVQVRLPQLHIAAGALAGVVDGSSLTADGVAYLVRQIDRSLDGRLHIYHLARA